MYRKKGKNRNNKKKKFKLRAYVVTLDNAILGFCFKLIS